MSDNAPVLAAIEALRYAVRIIDRHDDVICHISDIEKAIADLQKWVDDLEYHYPFNSYKNICIPTEGLLIPYEAAKHLLKGIKNDPSKK